MEIESKVGRREQERVINILSRLNKVKFKIDYQGQNRYLLKSNLFLNYEIKHFFVLI